jgi:hypothetical protein
LSTLADLKKAKAYSDSKNYEEKHLILRKLIETAPADFMVDSEASDIVGITHTPTGFRMHLPKNILTGLNVGSSPNSKAAGIAMTATQGLPRTATKKRPSISGTVRANITKATMKENPSKPKAKTPQERMFPATAEYQNKKMQQNAVMAKIKQGNVILGNASKYMGYSPGVWYDDSVSHVNRSRVGNLVTGVGLTGLGLASIPVLKYLFPERFEDKGTALSIAAVLGGMSLPWLVNAPHTAWEFKNFAHTANKDYAAQNRARLETDIAIRSPKLDRLPGDPIKPNTATKTSYVRIPLGTPIPKMYLADMAAEQLSSGYIDYGQAAGLMMAASQASNKPWFTVGDLARTAIGAGAGAVAATAAAKGIGMFMNLKPTEQTIMQGTGAALGALINLGKLGI